MPDYVQDQLSHLLASCMTLANGKTFKLQFPGEGDRNIETKSPRISETGFVWDWLNMLTQWEVSTQEHCPQVRLNPFLFLGTYEDYISQPPLVWYWGHGLASKTCSPTLCLVTPCSWLAGKVSSAKGFRNAEGAAEPPHERNPGHTVTPCTVAAPHW